MVVGLCCFCFVAGLVYCDYYYIPCIADYYCIFCFDCYYIFCCCLNFVNFDFGLYLHFLCLVRHYSNERNDRRYYLNVNSKSLDLFVVERFEFFVEFFVAELPSFLCVSWMLLPSMGCGEVAETMFTVAWDPFLRLGYISMKACSSTARAKAATGLAGLLFRSSYLSWAS